MRVLISHRNIRRLWRGIGVACALVTAIAAADGASRGPFAVWAIGLPDGYVMMEHQAPVIHAADQIETLLRAPTSAMFQRGTKG